jgi:hypothetical protein
MVAAVKYGRVSARINGLAVVRRSSSTHPRAEQRGSKAVGALEVCANEGAAAANWVDKHYNRCHVSGLAHNFGLGPWITGGRGGYVMVLSSTKMGAPASKEGT